MGLSAKKKVAESADLNVFMSFIKRLLSNKILLKENTVTIISCRIIRVPEHLSFFRVGP